MDRSTLLIAAGLVVFGLSVITQFGSRGETTSAEPPDSSTPTNIEPLARLTQNPIDRPIAVVRGEAASTSEEVHPLLEFKHAVTEHAASVDPMMVFGIENFSDAQIAAYNELHVVPFNKAIGKSCEEVLDETMSLLAAGSTTTQCKTLRDQPPHPYLDIPLDQLAELALADPAAANIMGMRIESDDGERKRWYIRASALSGKSGPILELANRRYSSVSEYKRQAEGLLEEVIVIDALKNRAMLEAVAKKLGDPRANDEYWREKLGQELGVDALGELDAAILGTLNSMAQVQRDITGSTQIQGIIDA
jgi:hypothetical protein